MGRRAKYDFDIKIIDFLGANGWNLAEIARDYYICNRTVLYRWYKKNYPDHIFISRSTKTKLSETDLKEIKRGATNALANMESITNKIKTGMELTQ